MHVIKIGKVSWSRFFIHFQVYWHSVAVLHLNLLVIHLFCYFTFSDFLFIITALPWDISTLHKFCGHYKTSDNVHQSTGILRLKDREAQGQEDHVPPNLYNLYSICYDKRKTEITAAERITYCMNHIHEKGLLLRPHVQCLQFKGEGLSSDSKLQFGNSCIDKEKIKSKFTRQMAHSVYGCLQKGHSKEDYACYFPPLHHRPNHTKDALYCINDGEKRKVFTNFGSVKSAFV